MSKRTKLITKVLMTSIFLSVSIFFWGMKVGATDIGSEYQIPVLQEEEKCYEFKDGVLTLKGNVDREQLENFEDKDKVEKIIAKKGTVLPNDCSYLFAGKRWNLHTNSDRYINVKSIDLSNSDTSQVTNMSYMFHICSSLTDLDVSRFDTSNVTDMESMFYECNALTSSMM